MHRQAPLKVAGIDEVFAKAGGASEIHRKHAIAAIGEQLVDRVKAIAITRPRPAMHQQHHWHRRIGHAVRVAVAAGRQSEV